MVVVMVELMVRGLVHGWQAQPLSYIFSLIFNLQLF